MCRPCQKTEIPLWHGRKVPILHQDETVFNKKPPRKTTQNPNNKPNTREGKGWFFPGMAFQNKRPVFEEQDGAEPSRQADGKPAAQNDVQSGNLPMEISHFSEGRRGTYALCWVRRWLQPAGQGWTSCLWSISGFWSQMDWSVKSDNACVWPLGGYRGWENANPSRLERTEGAHSSIGVPQSYAGGRYNWNCGT